MRGVSFKETIQRLWKHRVLIGLFLVVFWMYWANTFHTRFPDEFDNIVGGWYILHGRLPYIGFFSHHNPGAYYIASLITLISRQSFVLFRQIWAVVLFATITASYIYLRKKLGEKDTDFYLAYLLLIAISATYYWGQMLLSETVVGYMLVPAWVLLLLKCVKKQFLTMGDIVFFSLTSAVALITSFTFVFAYGFFFLFILYYLSQSVGVFSKKMFRALSILVSPYILFLIYLLVTGSLSEFYFQSIIYNRDYYIYNFPIVSGQVSTHPVRYAISIFYNNLHQFYALLTQVRNFNFSYPVNITLALINISLLIYLILKRKFTLSTLLYLLMVYLNARGQPLDSKETDFHSTVYIMFSLLNFTVVVSLLAQEINRQITSLNRLLYSFLLILLSVYGFFMTLFLSKSFAEKVYTKFMGQAPAIYDEPVVAPIINRIVSRDEYFWIGPFEFQELLYINGRLPSKYHWFLPANARSEKIKSEITSDLLTKRPKLIVFKEDFAVFGVLPQDFNYPIVNILREHYFRLEDLEKEGFTYRPTITDLHNFDIAQNFYFDKNRKEEIIDLLLKERIIEPVKS